MSIVISKYPSTLCAAKNPVVFLIQSDPLTGTPAIPIQFSLQWLADPLPGTVVFESLTAHSLDLGIIGDSQEIPLLVIDQTWEDWLTFAMGVMLDKLNEAYFNWTGDVNHWTATIDVDYFSILFESPWSVVPSRQIDSVIFTGATNVNTSHSNGTAPSGDAKPMSWHVFELWQSSLIFRDLLSPFNDGFFLTSLTDVSELLLGSIPKYYFFTSPPVFPNFVNRNQVMFPFYVQFTEDCLNWPEGYSTPALQTSYWFYALNGGVPPWRHVDFFEAYDTFEDYFIDTKRCFLTWHWFNKEVAFNSPETLYFLNKDYIDTETYTLIITPKIKMASAEPIEIEIDSTGFKKYEVYEFNVSPAAIAQYANFDVDELLSYTVCLYVHGAAITDTLTYSVNYRYTPNERSFLFLNTLGAFETIRFCGETVEEDTYKREYFDQTALAQYNPFSKSKGQILPEIITSDKLNSGWVSIEEAQWMRDFIFSQEVYEIMGSKHYPVLVTQDKVEVHRDNAFLRSISVMVERIDLKNVFQAISGEMPIQTSESVPEPF